MTPHPRPRRRLRRTRATAGYVHRNSGPAALIVATIALISTFTGAADAAREAVQRVVSKPRPGAVLKLDRKGKFPAKAIPKVAAARTADRLGDSREADLELNCAADTVDLGTWCLGSSPYPVPAEDAGKNDYAYATQHCVEAGGYLPTAAQLIGAAPRVKLASYINDDELTASIDIDPSDGLRDRREMSATLVSVQAGSSAAGALGVSDGSKGNPRTGEPDPPAAPAVPTPDTLQYVTVVDNHEKGGVAGSKPVGQAESFRCAFAKTQGAPAAEEG